MINHGDELQKLFEQERRKAQGLETHFTFDAYQEMALRTLNDKGREQNIVHCAMGVASEALELYAELYGTSNSLDDRVPLGLLGELGDCLWYASVMADSMGLKFSSILDANSKTGTIDECAIDISLSHGGGLLSMAKAYQFYGKPFNHEKLRDELVGYVLGLQFLSCEWELPLEDACVANIRKLSARYPDKFTAEQAINRDYLVESVAAGTKIS